MIDIHSHILPDVDDGSEDLDTSLEMLLMAAESGVDTIVATPHCNVPDEFDNYVSQDMSRRWHEFAQEVEREMIPIRLVRGMEIFATEDLPELLEDGLVWTLNDTRYFLIEFAFEEDPYFCREVLRDCARRGFNPIIAHPERYVFVQEDPDIAFDWCVSGYGLQLNKGSLLGRFGPMAQETAELLLNHGLAACVASDAHGVFQRTTHMADIRAYLNEEFGKDYSDLLLTVNPSRILAGKPLMGFEPIPFYENKKGRNFEWED